MKVKLDDVLGAFEMSDDEMKYYYDPETEEVILVSDEIEMTEDKAAEFEANFDRYLALPTEAEIDDYGIMADFIDGLPAGEQQQKLARGINGRGAFRVFRELLDDFQLTQSWYDYQNSMYRQLAIDWCTENHVTYTED